MSQISPPIRIVLVAAIAFLGVYMLLLRPKDAVVPPADPAPNVQTSEPAVSEPGKVAEAAQNAVAAANGQLSEQESVDGVDTGESPAGTVAARGRKAEEAAVAASQAVDTAGLPKRVAKAIRQHKTLVVLFWNGKSADDKAVRKAVAKVDRWDGRVHVETASIKKIGKYGRIARGVDVEQSPTVVVADSELRAETLVGYVDTATIDQAVVDAFRNTDGVFTDAYLRKVDGVCREYRSTFNKIPHSYLTTSPRAFAAAIKRVSTVYPGFASAFRAVKAPRKWRTFKAAIVANNAAAVSYYADLAAYLGANPSRARVVAGAERFASRRAAINKGFAPRMRRARLTRCLS